jgi:integrase
MTAAFTGLRASELRGLRWADIDLVKREVRVTQRADRFNDIGSPKSKQGRRTVPLPAILTQVLREWRLVCPKAKTGECDDQGKAIAVLKYAFPNGAGNIETHANIVRRGLWPTWIQAGIISPHDVKSAAPTAKYKGMHCLRHFFASWCINPPSAGGMGLAIKQVQERMGHASVLMTSDRYAHLFPREDIATEIDAAERALLG